MVLEVLETEKKRRSIEDRLKYYKPYPKQRDFHAAGATARERLLMAGNQLGKTLAGGFEVAMHATGRYPDWWRGKRFDLREGGEGCGMTNSDDTRLDAILDDARAGRVTPEAAFAAIEADPAIYKAAKMRMLRAAMRDVIQPGGDKVLTDAELLKRMLSEKNT